MGQPSILVIDGNRAATRAQQVAAGGEPSGEGYAQVLKSLGAVRCDIVRPADGEVRFASGAGLASYDGVAITGSALNVYDGGAHIERQIELARATFAAGRAHRHLRAPAGGGARGRRSGAPQSAGAGVRI